MADLVTNVFSDSTTLAVGPSTTIVPGEIENLVDDLLILKVTQSLNNATNVSNINVTTPVGWTLLTDLRDQELRSWIFWRRATAADETAPNVISDTAAEWTTSLTVVTDVDWSNGGLVQFVENTAGGDHQSPDLTSSALGVASAIVCLHSVERRNQNGFRYPETRPQTFYLGNAQTGTSEGIDNTSAAGWDYFPARNTNFDGPFWEASGGGDSVAFNIEVLVLGNIVPLQITTLIADASDPNTYLTNADWIRAVMPTRVNLDGTAMTTWDFDAASDVDPLTDQITLPGHGMDESMTVYLEDNGNTPPTGLTNDTFYYVQPVDANTITLCALPTEDADGTGDLYASGTTKLSPLDITADGTGTITLVECRMINSSTNPLDINRGNNGNSSNVGPAPGAYIGDNGYNQNWLGTCQRFNNVADISSEVLTFQWDINGQGRADRGILLLIDEDGDWMSWTLYKQGVSPNDIGPTDFQVEPGASAVQAVRYQQGGTFDASRVRFFVLSVRGRNTSVSRFSNANSAPGAVNYGGSLTVINGEEATWEQVIQLAQLYTDGITQPSDLQFTSTVSINLGNGTDPISFSDSEKSVAFPPLADGVNTFENYLSGLGIGVNVPAGGLVRIVNTQIGASVPFNLDVQSDPAGSVILDGNAYVFPNAVLDADVPINRNVFVGGGGVTDNGAQIRNSTFIINDQVGADNGVIIWSGASDIQTTTFEAASDLTNGHAIIITTPGTYTFNDLTFTGFGVDESNTAAVYNNSGGAVTINIAGGTSPTVRNGAGASTTVVASVPVDVTVIRQDTGAVVENARVRITENPGGAVVLEGLTNASGQLSGSFSGSTPQAITGRVRKASSSPFFKTGDIIGTITSAGFSVTVALILDE